MSATSGEAMTRWIPPLLLGGSWQMAIDEWLLDEALARPARQREPVLRLYRWQRPTLSLGFHQRSLPDRWWTLAAAGAIDLVRRPSGGRAVLHAGDLTYALIWPDPPPRRSEAYRRSCVWLQAVFHELGQPLHFGRRSATGGGDNCFASGTTADLVHEDGAKRIGSAQLWRRGCLLQHGTILIDPPAALWQAVFAAVPPPLRPLPLSVEALTQRLRQAAARHLPWSPAAMAEQPLATRELAVIAPRLPRYRATPPDLPAVSPKDTSPELTMERAT